jgi:MbtH protein
MTSDRFHVVINDAGQYSLWRADRPPAGWWLEGMAGSREECLDHIERTWTDIRPTGHSTADLRSPG